MAKRLGTNLLRYSSGVIAFFAIILIAFALRRFFSLVLDPTPLLILVVIATSWYAGRWPGLLVILIYEVTVHYLATPQPLSVKFLLVILNRQIILMALVLFVSSRRAAQNRVQEQREWLRVSLASIGDAVIATDTEGKVTFVNPTAEALTGVSLSVATGRPLEAAFNIINEHTRLPVESPVTKVLREESVVGLANHTVLISSDGREIPIDDSGAPIRGAQGEIVGVILVFRDVTERKQVEKEREGLLASEQAARLAAERAQELSTELLFREQKARSEAESAARLKDEFLATVSHELRTPLSSIYGWAKLLLEGVSDKQTQTRALESIERNARLQNKLIDDLLDVSSAITGKLQFKFQTVDLATVVRGAVDSIRPAAAAKAIELQITDGQPVGLVSADPDRLHQVLWNLLSNAVKFTPQGGRVGVQLEQTDGHVEVSISDTGQGIHADFLPYVFDRFTQADGSTTRRYGGLGLGLAIVRHLMELHGGTVRASSDGEGRGATFSIRLRVVSPGDVSPPDIQGEQFASAD